MCKDKDEVTHIHNRGGKIIIARGDSQEAGCTYKHIGNADSVHKVNARATPALPFEMAK